MNRQRAEEVRSRCSNLSHKVLTHRKYGHRLQVIEIGIKEILHDPGRFYVYCKLIGETGEVEEPLDEVLKNYLVL